LEDLFPPRGYLVGGLEHGFYFPFHIWDNPSQLIFFRGVEATNQLVSRSMTIFTVMAMIIVLFINQERNA